MAGFLPDPLAEDALCVKWPKSNFTELTAETLDTWGTNQDGFAETFDASASHLPPENWIYQDLDSRFPQIDALTADIELDPDPELPHAVESTIEALDASWRSFAGISDSEPPDGSGIPGVGDGSLDPGTLPGPDTLDTNAMLGLLVDAVIAKLPAGTTQDGTTQRSPGPAAGSSGATIGTGVSAPSDPNAPARSTTPTTPIPGTLYPHPPVQSFFGNISVNENGAVNWRAPVTSNDPITVTVKQTPGGIQDFASGRNGSQDAPWIFNGPADYLFELRSEGNVVDSVGVAGKNLL